MSLKNGVPGSRYSRKGGIGHLEFAGNVEKALGKAKEWVSLIMSQTSPRCLVEGSNAGGASEGSFWLSG